MDKTLVLNPRLSEKAYALSQARNTYVFDVPKEANKHSVARAVNAQFNVTVEKVNIANINGKVKRTVRKGGRASTGKQNDTKKAFVTLKTGDTLPLFAAIEEADAKSEEMNKAAEKAVEKRAKKEKK
jgi:large subunit ribosomal protein L23